MDEIGPFGRRVIGDSVDQPEDRPSGSGKPFTRAFSSTDPHDEEIDLRELLRTLWRRKMVLIGSFVMITTIAVLVVFQLTPIFTAQSQVMIGVRQSKVVDVEAVLSGLSADSAAVQSEVEVLRSRSLATRVVENLGLIDDPEFNGSLRPKGSFATWFKPSDLLPESWLLVLRGAREAPDLLPEEETERTKAAVVNAFIGRLSVSPVRRSRVITVAFASENPRKASLIANSLADHYILDQLEAKFEATQRATTWLNERISGLRDKVRQGERAVEAYRARSGLVEGKGAKVNTQQLSELNSQVILARTDRAEAEARLRQVGTLMNDGRSIDSVAEVLDSPLIQELRGQETELLREVGDLSSRYGERHPKMINIRAEQRDLRGKIESEVRKIIKGLENEVEVARVREGSLRESLKELEKEVTTDNRAEIKLRELERDAQANRLLYETFVSRFKETSQQDDIQQADARVISKADVPGGPSYPRKRLFVGLAAVGSIFIGILLVFVLERLDNGFRSPEQVERMTGVPALGLVPLARGWKWKGRPSRIKDYVIAKPTSSVTESLRSLRTVLSLSDVDRPPKVICVTSSVPGEGKSTLAVWLTRVAAGSGQRTLLIDCDMRRPSLHRMFGISNENNLVDLLTEKQSLEDSVTADEATGGQLLPARVLRGNPLDLLGSPYMKELFQAFRTHFDLVILDSPPVLAVSDALVLSQEVDKTIFLVKWDTTPREAVLAGLKRLTDVGADLAGVVLTQVDVRKHARYGYGDTGYYYGRYREYYAD